MTCGLKRPRKPSYHAQTEVFLSEGYTDNNKNCSYWAEKGECERNTVYMLTNCRKSCDLHGKQCKSWAERGECEKSPAYMFRNCERSCSRQGTFYLYTQEIFKLLIEEGCWLCVRMLLPNVVRRCCREAAALRCARHAKRGGAAVEMGHNVRLRVLIVRVSPLWY